MEMTGGSVYMLVHIYTLSLHHMTPSQFLVISTLTLKLTLLLDVDVMGNQSLVQINPYGSAVNSS
jgi:hypothetical protein